MNIIALLVGALLRAVPMGGKRTYIIGGIGLLVAAGLLASGNYAEGGTLLVLALQGIFQRAGTDKLEASIMDAIANTSAASQPNVALPEGCDGTANDLVRGDTHCIGGDSQP